METLPPNILDVRQNVDKDGSTEYELARQIATGLSAPTGQKKMPTMLLYDTNGLRLYDEITTKAPEYYLFGAEEQILKEHANDIVRAQHSYEAGHITDGEVILELGAGSLRKSSHLMLALAGLPSVASTLPTYFALDLEKRELERTLSELTSSDVGAQISQRLEVKGLLATYDEGLKYIESGGLQEKNNGPRWSGLQSRGTSRSSDDSNTNSSDDSDRKTGTSYTSPSTPEMTQPPLHILFLGSSLGNFARQEGADFLRSLPLKRGSDTLLLGIDHDNAPALITEAYNDPKGYTKAFIMNGLTVSGRVLGDASLFDGDHWDYTGKYNEKERRHEAYYRSKIEQKLLHPKTNQEFFFKADELIEVEVSYKFSEIDTFKLFTDAGLRPIQRWTDSASKYSLWLLEKPAFSFPLLKAPSGDSSPFNIPLIPEWENMWVLWDFITRRMIPSSMLLQKPIDLRHICLFYLGHIPTFLDIHLSRLLNEDHTEPEHFKDIFERGIDPNIDDPDDIHPHSEVPLYDNDWPTLHSILDFQSRVRDRVRSLYRKLESGKLELTRKVARVLFMTYEHEGLHAETLLYMLLQRAGTGTIAPPEFARPDWVSLKAGWDSAPAPASRTVTLGPEDVVIGHNDIEGEDYDPTTKTKVDPSHSFGWDNESPARIVHVAKFTIEWRPITNGEYYNFYRNAGKGKVEMPASWIEEDGEMRVRTFQGSVSLEEVAKDWPVIANYNDLSRYALVKGGRLPTDPELRLFMDKFHCGYEGGANAGFRNWHPVPATTGGESKGHNGGVWEWTSTEFDNYEGFTASKLYPGYSTDFFDGRHQVVIGGSYATIPRIFDRRTFCNYYQSKYQYAFIGGRVCYPSASE